MVNREINNLLLGCAHILASDEKIKRDNIAYVALENGINKLLEKYNLSQASYGKTINNSLLRTSTSYLTNGDIRSVIKALVGIKSSYKTQFNKIFISHSSSDEKIVEKFVGLMEYIGLTDKHIFCSSVPGYGIPLGENIYDYLKKEFEDSNLFVIFMLSANYYKSAACLNEMGATWINKHDYQAILLKDFEFKDIVGAIDPLSISFSIDDKFRLNEFRDKMVGAFTLEPKNNSRWEQQRDDFIQNIK